MSLDAALAAVPALVEEVRELRREVSELRGLVDRPRWLSRTEAAEQLGVHRDTVDAMVRDGRLEHRRAGRRVLIRLEASQ